MIDPKESGQSGAELAEGQNKLDAIEATSTTAGAQPGKSETGQASKRVGYVQLMRTPETEEFMRRDPKGFILAAFIAIRARRTGKLAFDGLSIGDAMLGDHAVYGMTESEYREAKKRLDKIGFATFRATSKGTIATLINTDVFDPNLENNNEQHNGQHSGQATDKQRTSNGRATTKKKGNPRKRGVPPSYKKEKVLENASDVVPVVDSGEPPATSGDFWEGC